VIRGLGSDVRAAELTWSRVQTSRRACFLTQSEYSIYKLFDNYCHVCCPSCCRALTNRRSTNSMRALFCLAALLALAGPAWATLGDNGMTTYNGRKREENTVVFGNQLVVDLMATTTVRFAADLLKGTFKPTPNAPATEKKEVRVQNMLLQIWWQQPWLLLPAGSSCSSSHHCCCNARTLAESERCNSSDGCCCNSLQCHCQHSTWQGHPILAVNASAMIVSLVQMANPAFQHPPCLPAVSHLSSPALEQPLDPALIVPSKDESPPHCPNQPSLLLL
jgi:hypothetical protein